jgi:hypothetical protein
MLCLGASKDSTSFRDRFCSSGVVSERQRLRCPKSRDRPNQADEQKGLFCVHSFDRAFRLVLPTGMVAVLATIMTVGWSTEPDRYFRGYAPRQPVPFSHQLHASSLKIPCGYCHSGATRSRFAGVPAVQTCMGCHSVTKTDSPSIQQLAQIYDRGQALEWKRAHTLPDYVFFDHRPHVNAGVACQTCHGEVQNMKVLTRQMSLRMSNCLACHRDPLLALPQGSKVLKGSENCSSCHR